MNLGLQTYITLNVHETQQFDINIDIICFNHQPHSKMQTACIHTFNIYGAEVEV